MTAAGVLLMTYGSAVTSADVPAYLRSVYRGREPAPAVVAEFERRYDVVGRSPLIEITRAQGAALQRALDDAHGRGRWLVEIGMLHSEPWIAAGVARLAAAGVRRITGIVLSPQFSPVIMGGYPRALAAAVEEQGGGVEAGVAGPWHLVGGFVDCLAGRVAGALAALGGDGEPPPVIFTAHSLPRSVVDRDTAYLDQLHETVRAVAERAALAPGSWQFAYQSAGHTPEEWLKPDLKDLLPKLRADGHGRVLVVPVQFLADHLEILYDIDVAAREEAEAAGLSFARIELPNTDPRFIQALRQVAEREEQPRSGG